MQGDLFGGAAARDALPVYVDALFEQVAKGAAARAVGERNGNQWCRMWSDDPDALHAMADRLDLKREWFQRAGRVPHYDLTPGKRAQAIKAGAKEQDLSEWLEQKRKS